jgi:hypothetical protein
MKRASVSCESEQQDFCAQSLDIRCDRAQCNEGKPDERRSRRLPQRPPRSSLVAMHDHSSGDDETEGKMNRMAGNLIARISESSESCDPVKSSYRDSLHT